MLELGKKQNLIIVKKVDFGVYLAENQESEDRVLLPKKQVPAEAEIGDHMEVFLYKDSDDRLISTTNTPLITLGEVAVLEVVQVAPIGAFLNWGLEKDLLLPFKEQTNKVKEGESYLIALYIDKSSRLCGTMKVYDYLELNSTYQKDDIVTGIVYEKSENFGLYVAVDNKFSGMVPTSEKFSDIRVGEVLQFRVSGVKPDGKLDLSMRQKAYLQIEEDADKILSVMDELGGEIPFGEKVEPEKIKEVFGLSKNAFKRAIGKLLKDGVILLSEDRINKKNK